MTIHKKILEELKKWGTETLSTLATLGICAGLILGIIMVLIFPALIYIIAKPEVLEKPETEDIALIILLELLYMLILKFVEKIGYEWGREERKQDN